ncbi:MAG: ArsA-related P-loop ATPase [Myxococcota bacterium]
MTARVAMCCGVGGVGKTTLAAALAVGHAQAGQRVVVVTIDPARRLAQALGTALGDVPSRVELPDARGTLDALMLDAGAAFDRAVARLAPDPAAADALLANRYYRAVSRGLAGTQEYMALVELHRLAEDGRWDLVVVDTPPAQDALDFFAAPERLSTVLSRSVAGALGRSWLGGAPARVLGRLIGGSVVGDLLAFFRLVGPVADGFRRHSAAAGALLRSDRARTWLVVDVRSPHRAGADAFHAALREIGPPFAGYLCNRVARDPGVDLARPAPPAPPGADPGGWQRAVDGLWQAARDEAASAAQHQRTLAELARDAPVWAVPELPQDEPGVAGLAALAAWLPPARPAA